MGTGQFESIWYITIMTGFIVMLCYYEKYRVFFRDFFSNDGMML